MPLRPPRLLAAVLLLFASLPASAGKAGDVRKEAFQLLNEGVSAYNRSDFRAAIPPLTRAAAMSLNSFRAHYFLGAALAGDRRWSEAVSAYTIALDLDPSHLQANVALGDAWLALGDLDEARPYYARALKLRAEFAPGLDGQARLAEAQADEDRAIALYERAIASDRGFADAYTHLGDLYLRRGKLDDAVKLLSEAVSIRPDFGPGLDRLAVAYGRLGFSNEAVATIRKAIELEPNNPEHRATLGEVLLGMGMVTGADAAFRAAIAIDDAQPRARAGLAEIERRNGRFDEALAQLDLALRDARLDAGAHAKLDARRAAIVAERDRTGALEARVAGGAATMADRVALAEVVAGRGDYARAADLLSASAPEGRDRERLAYYTFRAGRFREAHEIYAGLARAAKRADLEVNDGASLARAGDDGRAKEAFARALAIEPDHELAKLYMGNALLRLGDTAAAAQTYREYLAAHDAGTSSEQVRRILAQLAPAPPPAPAPTPTPEAKP